MKHNKLIAEFMELEATPKYNPKEYYVKEYNSGEWYLPEEMEYHTSWDWLMPVIKKIDSYACEEMDFSDYDDYRNKYVFIHNISLHNDIREVYNQVVEFIKQYNKDES